MCIYTHYQDCINDEDFPGFGFLVNLCLACEAVGETKMSLFRPSIPSSVYKTLGVGLFSKLLGTELSN